MDLGLGAGGSWQRLPSVQGIASVIMALPFKLTEDRESGEEAALIRYLLRGLPAVAVAWALHSRAAQSKSLGRDPASEGSSAIQPCCYPTTCPTLGCASGPSLQASLTEAARCGMGCRRNTAEACCTHLPAPVLGPSCLKACMVGGGRLGLGQKAYLAEACGQGACNPQFDLVCGKELNTEAVQTMFMVGLLIGSLIFGFLSDK